MSAGPAPASDLLWMATQVETLFVHDAAGRILHFNGPSGDRDPAPRFFFGRTRLGNLWRFGSGVGTELVRELARLAALEAPAFDPERPPERFASFVERLEAAAPVVRSFHGPAFRFPDPLPPMNGAVSWITAGDAAALGEDFPGLRRSLEGRQPCAAVMEAGRIVAVCFAATLPGPGGAVEAGVETLEGYRGRGYASRITAAWAAELARRGGVPLYSTDWSNAASLGVARRLGLVPYGVDLHFR